MSPGSVYGTIGASVAPEASGRNATLQWVSPPIMSVSEPTKRPAGVAIMSLTPTPRVRVGFQE